MTLNIGDATSAAATSELKRELEKAGILTSLKQDKFILAGATCADDWDSLHAFGLPVANAEARFAGTFMIHRIPADQFLQLYSALAGVNVGAPSVPNDHFTFVGHEDLTTADIIRAMDTILFWNGFRIVPQDQRTYRAVRFSD
jgi:hypothetical protein